MVGRRLAWSPHLWNMVGALLVVAVLGSLPCWLGFGACCWACVRYVQACGCCFCWLGGALGGGGPWIRTDKASYFPSYCNFRQTNAYTTPLFWVQLDSLLFHIIVAKFQVHALQHYGQ